jgi:uncharacterized Zn-finger protein
MPPTMTKVKIIYFIIFSVHLEKKGSVKCEVCHKKLSRKENLERHFQTIHRNEKMFVCPVCRKRFTGKRGMTFHLESAHYDLEKVEKYYKYIMH